ncbi:MAG: restriction endonuclease subunit S [Treponema sp.]|jgi:restriction endonuclease S subunit|nr:restriction endonuclease subunit S [Treponema sp.]
MALFRLGDIATIQIGLILERKRASTDSLYIYKRLTLRSLENDSINPEAIEPFYSTEPLHSEYLTRAGTIVMKLSFPLNPIVITKEMEDFLIPSQMVSIQLVKPVMPEYLCLYLSQDFVVERLLANYLGIAQRAITVETLSNFEIRIPSLKNQQIICDYHQNYGRLSDLRKELEKEEKNMMKYIFSELSK